jgi:hypothetical protein
MVSIDVNDPPIDVFDISLLLGLPNHLLEHTLPSTEIPSPPQHKMKSSDLTSIKRPANLLSFATFILSQPFFLSRPFIHPSTFYSRRPLLLSLQRTL